jgi:hypothetical protein
MLAQLGWKTTLGNIPRALLAVSLSLSMVGVFGQSIVLDQQQAVINPEGGLYIGQFERQRLAQVVTAGRNGSLTTIGLAVGCQLLAQFTIEVQGTSSGKPNNVVLTSGTFANVGLPDPLTFKQFTLPVPVQFQQGDQFAIVLSTDSEFGSHSCGSSLGPAGDPYSGGDAFVNSLGGPPGQWNRLADLNPGTGADLPFQTFVSIYAAVEQPVPTLSEWSVVLLAAMLLLSSLAALRFR